MTLRILYNGDCPICAREIAHYRDLARRSGAEIAFDDLSRLDPAALPIPAEAARRRLHAMQDDRLIHGLPAFRALWSRLPGWRWLARLTGLPLVRPVAAWTYDRVLAPALYWNLQRRARRTCSVS
jgi:predicted DCC family thiol-disulfide oxidoreductase YuxK